MLLEQKEKRTLVHQQAFDAATRQKGAACGAAKAATRFATWVGRVLVGVSLVVILSVWVARRQRPQLPPPVQNSPVTLVDEVEHVPPLAWKAIPMTLHHSGIVNIDARVVQGNTIDVFLTTRDQFAVPQKVEWNSLKIYRDISATGTRIFKWNGRLGPGGFYLVVRDMTVGIPTASNTDISIKVVLDP